MDAVLRRTVKAEIKAHAESGQAEKRARLKKWVGEVVLKALKDGLR